jgi:Myofilin
VRFDSGTRKTGVFFCVVLGSEELKAKDSEKHKTNVFDPFSKYPTDEFKTCYDDNSPAAERIKRPGYHYETLMRDIYGRSPRNLH